MDAAGNYLKRHTEALVKAVGVVTACEVTGKSKATLGRYYSDHEEHADRFMPVNAVAALEIAAGYPHLTQALAELSNARVEFDGRRRKDTVKGTVNGDVIALSQRFATLLGEYQQSIADGKITVNEAKRLLKETTMIQRVLVHMKIHLEDESV
jgi:hypothetical protein